MAATAFYTRRLPRLGGKALARRGRGVFAWLLVLATVVPAAPAPVPLHLQLIPNKALS
jgi:hypothetical protein